MVRIANECFNYTYCTVAYKCNKRQLFAIPASYENNIALAKPEGRGGHARLDPLFRQPFSSWPCTIVQLSSFHFSCHLIEFCCPPVCSCFHFRPREKSLCEAFGRQSESEKDFVTSWRLSIPLSFHPLFRLWPTFLSPRFIAFFCSSLFCASFILFFSLRSIRAWRSWFREPRTQARSDGIPLFCQSDLPGQPWLSGATDTLRPSVWRSSVASTTTSFPHAGVEWLGTPPLTSPRRGRVVLARRARPQRGPLRQIARQGRQPPPRGRFPVQPRSSPLLRVLARQARPQRGPLRRWARQGR